MDIRFVSSLTPDDEDRLATVLAQVVGSLLGRSSIAYAVHIRTKGGKEVVESSATKPLTIVSPDIEAVRVTT